MCQVTIPNSSDDRKLFSEEMRFIYDKHLSLFNIRREHEWKVFFGMITLLGLSTAALLNYRIQLTPQQKHLWALGMTLLFVAHFFYQSGVQHRNRIDRLVMDEVNRHLCAAMNLDKNCFIRLSTDAGEEKDFVTDGGRLDLPWYNIRYIWAFALQTVTLLLICAVSYVIASGHIVALKP
ncbi:hypothetical protein GO988_07100 [Hymenobacter sp. HMF4947]|uniref:Uncharacterized protein n=1 Tax=Hymenobacter ginkgonis TaxID=2682976 RepID=A0A7K1TCE8_9BACT|nr:hypothetical protein [Hymenobacter ginkgonis]MVN76087.1 hypothetical protein [Hymenobacter ginkgonis]